MGIGDYTRILTLSGSAVTKAPCCCSSPNAGIQEQSQRLLNCQRFNPFESDDLAGIEKASLNILRLQPWVATKYGLGRIPGCQHSQHVLYRQTPAANERLTPKMAGSTVILCNNLFSFIEPNVLISR